MDKIWISNLRVLATFAVVIVHVSAKFLTQGNVMFNNEWWTGLIFTSSMKFCVPIFVMISGALLLPKRYNLEDHLNKRFVRVLLPFLFWTFVYAFVDVSISTIKHDPNFIMNSAKHIASCVLFGARGHLWYVYMIIGIYLFFPVIQKWIINYEINELRLYLLLWIGTLLINWFITSTPGEKGYNFEKGVDLAYFQGFLGYFLLGHYLSINNFLNSRKGLWLCITIFIGGIFITCLGTYYVSFHFNVYSRNFIRYLTPNVLLMSIGIFLIFKNFINVQIKSTFFSNLFNLISKYSYGIYLSHILVLSLLEQIGIDRMFINPILGTPITTIITVVVSLAITIAINKLPYGKFVSG